MENKKIYTIWQHVNGNVHILGVFSDKTIESQIANIMSKLYPDEEFEICEFDLDKLTADGEKKVMKRIDDLIQESGLKDIIEKYKEVKDE